jgi:hypothetical protein
MGLRAAARHIHTRGEAASARPPFCCVVTQQSAVGGPAALWQVLANSQTQAAEQQHGGKSPAAPAHIMHFFSKPSAKRCEDLGLRATAACWTPYPACSSGVLDFEQWIASALAGGHPQASADACSCDAEQTLLVIDCLDAAILYHGHLSILRSLQSLLHSRRVSGVLTQLNAACHPPAVVASVQQLATCMLVIKPASSLQSDIVKSQCGRAVHVEAVATTLRHSGAAATACVTKLAFKNIILQKIICATDDCSCFTARQALC